MTDTTRCAFAAARRWLAENKGWQITPETDLCPACRTEGATA